MFSGRRLPLTLAFAGLLLLAFGAGCQGFFVKPTLSSLVVTPATPTIQTGTSGNAVQMSAVGTYNDGSTGNPAVGWSSSSTSIATVSANGLVTAVAEGTSTITATATQNPSITGSQSVTVTAGCINSITISPTNPTIRVSTQPNTQQFTAIATTCNGNIDVTNTATWLSSDTGVATITSGLATAVAVGTTNITASVGTINSNSELLTVNQ